MKERFEWVQSWCDEALSDDLPRVLLIGDSITRQYQDRVRELLRGKCYVDYFRRLMRQIRLFTERL